jgi:hypothetical protein
MKYNKRIVKRTLVDADIEINLILAAQVKFLNWLKEKYPTARKEYDDFRLSQIINP